MTDIRSEPLRVASRRFTGRAAGRALVGPRPRQPDRRAHRLQRRLRAAVRDRPPHGRRPRARGMTDSLRVGSTFGDETVDVPLAELDPAADRGAAGWSAYPLGVAWALGRVRRRPRRRARSRLFIDSDVPVGAGLSSSAAHRERRRARPERPLAARSGSPDPGPRRADGPRTTSSAPRPGSWTSPLRCSARRMPRCSSTAAASTTAIVPLGLEAPGSTILVIDTGVDARARDRRIRRAAGILRSRARQRWASHSLRDLIVDDLGRAQALLDDVTFRRVRHVVTENQRVLDTVAALDRLARADRRAAGRLAPLDA